jgi:hypothetical protein
VGGTTGGSGANVGSGAAVVGSVTDVSGTTDVSGIVDGSGTAVDVSGVGGELPVETGSVPERSPEIGVASSDEHAATASTRTIPIARIRRDIMIPTSTVVR